MSNMENLAPADAGQAVTTRLTVDYSDLAIATTKLLADARTLPATVTTKDDLGKVSTHIVAMRDTVGRSTAFHKKEKEPFLRDGRAVDNFFFGINKRLSQAIEILTIRADAYNQAMLAIERKRRQDEAIEAARVADEARLAAERARKPEIIERKEFVADVAEQRAEAAVEATKASAADMVRTRFEDSPVMSTMKQEGYVKIVDLSKVPLETLRPYFKEEHILAALKVYAKLTDYKNPIEGADIGKRDATVIR